MQLAEFVGAKLPRLNNVPAAQALSYDLVQLLNQAAANMLAEQEDAQT